MTEEKGGTSARSEVRQEGETSEDSWSFIHQSSPCQALGEGLSFRDK